MAKESGLPRGIYEKVAGSKIYWIRYTDSSGDERREKCGNITAAKARLSIRHAEKTQGLQTHTPRTVLFGALIDDAITYVEAENDVYAARDLKYKMERIRGRFATIPAARITQSSVIGWLEEETKARNWSSASRNRYQAAWSLIFRIAIQNKKVRENPAAKIKRRREDNERTRWLTPAEEVKLTRVIEERYPSYVPVFQLAIHTGMRASELLRSRVGDYNAGTGMFRIRQKKVRTAPTFRYVPASPIAVLAYQRLAAGKKDGDVLCSKQETGRGDLDLHQTRYWFDPCVKAACLMDLLWHDLRHTFASRLVMAGTPLAAVARYMGHQSISMTMRYTHMMPETHAHTVAAMMSYYGEAKPLEPTGNGTFGVIQGGKA